MVSTRFGHPSRVQPGVPTGGQFAPNRHAEADVTLDASAGDVHDGVRNLNETYMQWRRTKADLNDALAAEQRDQAAFLRAVEDLRAVAPHLASVALDQAEHDERAQEAAPRRPGEYGNPVWADPAPPDWYSTADGTVVHHASGPTVSSGQIVDNVEFDGQIFHRRRDGVHPSWPNAMRLQFNRPLTDAEMRHAAGLVGYAYAAEVRGERMSEPQRDTPYSFVLSTDTTKGRTDDLGQAMEAFEAVLPEMVLDGSPVRKTNRSGPGTRGTRLVDGLGEPGLTFEIYYDDVES